MRRILILLLMLPIMVVAETVPSWYDAESRREVYPQDIYITGFVISQLSHGEDPTQAINSLTEKARVNAASTIRVRIKSETEDRLGQLQYKDTEGSKRSLNRSLQSIINSSVDLVISGMKVETFHDEITNRVAVFAYVKISDLVRQTDRKLISVLSKIEDSLDETEQLAVNGHILQAHERGEKIVSLFDQVEDAQCILIAVDPMSDMESLQLEKIKKLKHRYILLSEKLRNSINIFIDCTTDLFEEQNPTLVEQIKKELSKKGCSFVNIMAQAEWVIRLKVLATLDVTSNYSDYDFVTLNVSGLVYDVKKQSGSEFSENDHASARKDRGGCKFAVNLMLQKGTIAKSTASDIIEILKSK